MGLNLSTASTSPIRRELELVINLFTQREIATALFTSVDRDQIGDISEEIVVAHYENKFDAKKSWGSAESNHGLLRREIYEANRLPAELAGPPADGPFIPSKFLK